MPPRPDRRFLTLQLSLGLLWLWLLPLIAEGPPEPVLRGDPIRWMLLWAGWCPSIPVAIWPCRLGRRWRGLLLSDLLFSAALILLCCTTYLPLYFTRIPWFWVFALPPRGLIAAGVLRLIRRVRRRGSP